MRLLMTSILLITATLVLGQRDYAADYAAGRVVQGPIYTIFGGDQPPEIFWRGEPINPDQVVRLDDQILSVNDEQGKERLRIYLNTDGNLEKVIDRKWQKLPEENERFAQEFDWDAPRKVTFENGLEFSYANGEASAYYEGNPVLVSGDRGNYRIKTPDFEAGISFGPKYGDRIYHYLTN